ncbi:MAG: ribonuclease HII [Flavobacteriales bacterium]|nr:MAG: ribonuclease HII [Flavobacteriales bacterium]|tara:strand:- start:6190 stop:6792 length:603 start_codon:yes stop_codon:yes gene_type:complete
MKLLPTQYSKKIEAGTDEAGRGCLAGPVSAAAVIFSENYSNPDLNDSKKLSEKKRNELRKIIEKDALAFSVVHVDNHEIDKINILNASILAMHKAIKQLKIVPSFILVDGNRFSKYGNLEHKCLISGDSKYQNVAAASILAKTYRDELMTKLGKRYPQYNWNTNKGYPTKLHKNSIKLYGPSIYHRKSFRLFDIQTELKF